MPQPRVTWDTRRPTLEPVALSRHLGRLVKWFFFGRRFLDVEKKRGRWGLKMFKVLLSIVVWFFLNRFRSILDYFGGFFSSCFQCVFIGHLPGSPGCWGDFPLFPKKTWARPDSHEFCWSYVWFKPPVNFSTQIPTNNQAKKSPSQWKQTWYVWVLHW